MSLHQLNAQADPREELLDGLVTGQATPPDALLKLGQHHAGGTPGFRFDIVGARDHSFPHPEDIAPLAAVLLTRVADNFAACQRALDDLATAGLALYGVLAIHPFSDGNGRTAVDFARFLLRRRWHANDAVLALPADAHRQLGRVFAPLDEHNDGTAEGFIALREGLAARLAGADLTWLDAEPAMRVATRWLREGLMDPGLKRAAANPTP